MEKLSSQILDCLVSRSCAKFTGTYKRILISLNLALRKHHMEDKFKPTYFLIAGGVMH